MPLDIPMVCLTSHTSILTRDGHPFHWHFWSPDRAIEPRLRRVQWLVGRWCSFQFFFGGPVGTFVTGCHSRGHQEGKLRVGGKRTRLLLLWQLTGIWNSWSHRGAGVKYSCAKPSFFLLDTSTSMWPDVKVHFFQSKITVSFFKMLTSYCGHVSMDGRLNYLHQNYPEGVRV